MYVMVRLAAFLSVCCIGYIIFAVQPDRKLLDELEFEIERSDFSDASEILEKHGFVSQSWTYYALAQVFSGSDGLAPIVYMGFDAKKVFFSLCPIECHFIVSERLETIPFIGIDRLYRFYIIKTEENKSKALPDHAYWIVTLP